MAPRTSVSANTAACKALDGSLDPLKAARPDWNFFNFLWSCFGVSQVALVVENPPANAGDAGDMG